MTFRVGMKVVCVRDGISPFSGKPSNVVRGRVYTVTQSWIDETWDHPVCLLAEIDPPGVAFAFDCNRFRPVVSRPTSIAIFTAMLNPSQVTVDAMNTADFAREHAG